MTLVYEVDVTAHVELADDVVSAPEDHWLHVLRQHLDERLVSVFKQRHLTTKQTNVFVGVFKQRHLTTKQTKVFVGVFKQRHLTTKQQLLVMRHQATSDDTNGSCKYWSLVPSINRI